MDTELDNKSTEQTEGMNDESQQHPAPSYHKDYTAGARPKRPRIRVTGNYASERKNDEGAFRPEGFATGLYQSSGNTNYQPRQQQAGYRPRYNNAEQGQQGYQPRQQTGFRPRYGSNNEQPQHDYQPRQQAGYRPRYADNNEASQQGYQPRQQQAGYRPRYNNGEQRPQGYQPRQQAGYRPRFAGNNEQAQQSYRPRPQQGYNQRYEGGTQGTGGYQPRNNGYQQYQGYQQRGFRQHTPGYDPNAKYSMKKRIEYNENNIDPTVPIRLNKYLANAGVCSRREADEFIQAGEVSVNGEIVKELGTKVMRTDAVVFRDKPVTLEKKVYILLNKPKDCVTTSDDPQQRKTVMDIVGNVCPERIYPVGRLDRNTTGVLLLTNDGDMASKLTHPKFLKKKVYHVFLDKPVTAHDLQQIADGIELEDGEIHADAVEYTDDTDKSQVGIEIHSGKNRIVRRIFEHLGYRVNKLDRVQFAGLTKKNLRRGDWRFLTEKEVDMLRMGAFE